MKQKLKVTARLPGTIHALRLWQGGYSFSVAIEARRGDELAYAFVNVRSLSKAEGRRIVSELFTAEDGVDKARKDKHFPDVANQAIKSMAFNAVADLRKSIVSNAHATALTEDKHRTALTNAAASHAAYLQTGAAAVDAIAELVDEYGLPGIKYTPAQFAQIAITRGLITEPVREYAVAVARQQIPQLSGAAL